MFNTSLIFFNSFIYANGDNLELNTRKLSIIRTNNKDILFLIECKMHINL